MFICQTILPNITCIGFVHIMSTVWEHMCTEEMCSVCICYNEDKVWLTCEWTLHNVIVWMMTYLTWIESGCDVDLLLMVYVLWLSIHLYYISHAVSNSVSSISLFIPFSIKINYNNTDVNTIVPNNSSMVYLIVSNEAISIVCYICKHVNYIQHIVINALQ